MLYALEGSDGPADLPAALDVIVDGGGTPRQFACRHEQHGAANERMIVDALRAAEAWLRVGKPPRRATQ